MIINEREQINLKFLKNYSLKEKHEFAVAITYDDVKNVSIMFHKFRKNCVRLLYCCVRNFVRKQ